MTESTKEKYNRAARLYDWYELPAEKLLFARLRKLAMTSVTGKTLEAGVGTGKNLPYYPQKVDLTAVDFSTAMLESAKIKARQLGLEEVTLMEQDIQTLTFTDDYFDSITSSCVFCTVPDPILGLKNLFRVLKPEGRAIFIEHMKTDNPLVNVFLYAMNIISTRMLGTSMIRDTEENIRKAGFTILSVRGYFFNIVRLIVATKESK